MQGTTILVCTQAPKGARSLERSLRAAGSNIAVATPDEVSAERLEQDGVDLAILEVSEAAERPLGVLKAAEIPVIVVATASAPSELARLVCEQRIDHVVHSADGTVANADTRELAASAEKILRGDVFGIEKYLAGFGLEPHRRRIMGARDRDGVVGEIREHLIDLGTRRRVANALATVADELITNAVYNAPRDVNGQPRYAHLDRREKIELEPHERVDLSYACDGESIAISVVDHFGSLGVADLRRVLERCCGESEQIEQKAGGAGIGLYTSLMACQQLVFNLEPGARTEVIAFARLAPRATGAGHSVHMFCESASEAVAPVPRAVTLSDSLQIEIEEFLEEEDTEPEEPTQPRQAVRGTPAPVSEGPRPGRATTERERRKRPTTEIVAILDEIRSASLHTRAIEVGVAYLSERFRSVAVYQSEGRGLRPLLAAGSGGLSTPTVDIERRLSEINDASATPTMLYGDDGPVLVPLCLGHSIWYVVCAAGPLGDAPPDDEVLQLLQDELERAIEGSWGQRPVSVAT